MADEWPSVPRSSLLAEGRGISYGIVQPGPHTDGGVPIVRVADIRDGRIRVDQPLRVSPAVESAYSRTRLRGGELLLTVVGTVGEVAVVPDTLRGWNVARAVAVIPVRDGVGAHWVKLALNAPQVRAMIDGRLNTTVQATLNLKDVAQLPILLPEADERERIYHVLGTLDDKIELNRRMNETLEAIARAIFKCWFVDFEPVRAKASGEPPESICRRLGLTPDLLALFPDRLVDSEFGEIPEGWRRERVDHLLELAYGKALKSTDRVAGSVPVYGSGGVTGYHNEGLVDGPGVIVGRKGTVGSLYWEDKPFYPIDTVFYVVPKVELTFCFYVLQTLGLDRMNTDAAVPGLNRNNAYRLLVASPPGDLRKEFDRFVKPMRDRMFASDQESQLLAMMRDALLPKFLSGELRVPLEGAA